MRSQRLRSVCALLLAMLLPSTLIAQTAITIPAGTYVFSELDEQVNTFIAENSVKNVISVSDTSTSGEGNSCGIIRVVTYEA